MVSSAPPDPFPLHTDVSLMAQSMERFFGELTERQLRLAVTSVDQLIAAITRYIDRRCKNPPPFVWTASVGRS